MVLVCQKCHNLIGYTNPHNDQKVVGVLCCKCYDEVIYEILNLGGKDDDSSVLRVQEDD